MSMKLDLQKLEQFDQMAIDGAAGASDRLSGLTGVETAVGCTRLHVVSTDDVTREFERDETLAISIGLDDYLEGEAVSVFDKRSAQQLAEAFMPMLPDGEYTSKHEAAVEEICNVMVSGYVDGWANVHDESIVMTPPTVVTSALPDEDGVDFSPANGANHVISQRSSITTPDGDIGFQMYLFLDESSGQSLLASESADRAITDENLAMLQAIAEEGTTAITEQLRAAIDRPIEAAVDRLEIVPTERLSTEATDAQSVGTVVELVDPSYGCVVVLFDEDSAASVASIADPASVAAVTDDSAAELDDVDETAGAIGALVATSLVDGLATTFETEIRTSEPAVLHDMRSAIVTDAVVNLDPSDRFVVTLGATLESADTELECDVYTLLTPNELSREWSQE